MTVMKRVRDTLLIGIIWAFAWAPVAILAGLVIDPDNSMDEMWFMIGALPGFLCGVVFAVLSGLAGGDRSRTTSPPRAALLGALSGVIVGILPFLVGESQVAMPEWLFAVLVIAAFTLMSAASAVVTAMWARRRSRLIAPPA